MAARSTRAAEVDAAAAVVEPGPVRLCPMDPDPQRGAKLWLRRCSSNRRWIAIAVSIASSVSGNARKKRPRSP